MQPKTMLVVDDEPLFRESLCESLAHAFPDVRIVSAAGGREAMERISERAVDVLVTDLRMQDGDGLALLEAAQQALPRVVVVTAHGDRQLGCSLHALGVLSCLEKPLDLDLLRRTVANLLAAPLARVGGVTLAALLEILLLQRATCAVRVANTASVGSIALDRGAIAGARTGKLRGDEALTELRNWPVAVIDVGGLREDLLPTSFSIDPNCAHELTKVTKT